MDPTHHTARLLEAFACLDDIFRRHKLTAFIHLRRYSEGAVALRFHCQWPAPEPVATELSRLADEADALFTLVNVDDRMTVVQFDPLPSLDQLSA